jgi:branched-chain amino acid transport system ATP-binding protein
LLEVDKIDSGYISKVLHGVSFHVKDGELISVLGSNGAGKTTTLKTISGLLKPMAGQIKLDERRIDGLTPRKIVEIGVSLVPEWRKLFPYMTVLENLLMGAYTKKARKKKNDTLEWVYSIFPKLKERRSQLAMTLSGGEQQMVAIGRGLMSRPKILMLDEPSTGLAPVLVQKMFEVIEQIRKEGMTILLVEQNAAQALQIADRAYVLENGHVVLEGSKDLIESEHVKRAYLGM